MMKKHTKFGKVIGWLGFLFFISGLFFFSESGVMAEDIPEFFYPFALPSIIIGVILLVISNFFRKKNV
ncbi:hypothetical protein D8M04_04015 [Oceanobacillus piezotolerans]|uniref:DUF3955 domain-containing protein n=1 Tax=Oceanobacillus piezotolerans TaxID=2448030 RepID=A0A498DBC6_9BACI|nr:hypothetical protein [Oceanobacillus piezotolerans]RLL48434.1 hypothetical protein D8M04_04015 [Oceanobacillus piezotolerans]